MRENIVTLHKDNQGKFHVNTADFPENLNGTRGQITLISDAHGARTYNIFQQAGMDYDAYNEYLNHHGCACCTLTSVLGAFAGSSQDPARLSGLTPDRTIREIETLVVPAEIWQENYARPLLKQSPINLYGMSQVLSHFGIDHVCIPSFRRRTAIQTIRAHLEKGLPVITEVSRVRYVHGIPVTIHDRRFAASYHFNALVAIEANGDTVWMIDSAHRDWAGQDQRLKRVSIREFINYMFSCHEKTARMPLYYEGRRSAGGFILIG